MIALTRLQQDIRSEMYNVNEGEDVIGQLFIFFSQDYLFLDGYLYLLVDEDFPEEEADELADDAIYQYLRHQCPMDYGEEYTSFEVYIIRKGENYIVKMGDDDILDEDEEDDVLSSE